MLISKKHFFFILLLISFIAPSIHIPSLNEPIRFSFFRTASCLASEDIYLNEQKFYEVVAQEAEKQLKEIEDLASKEDQQMIEANKSPLRKALHLIIEKIKGILPFEHLKELFKQHGVGVLSVSAAGELATTVILPALFLNTIDGGMGALLAGVVAGVPSPLYLLPTYFKLLEEFKQKKVAKELHLTRSDIKKRLKLRKIILKLNPENSMVFQLADNQELITTKRPFPYMLRQNLSDNTIALDELIKLYKKKFGSKAWVRLSKNLKNQSPQVQAMMLFQSFIKDQNDGPQVLSDFLRGRISKRTNSNTQNIYKDDLNRINDYKKMIAAKKQELSKEIHDSSTSKDLALEYKKAMKKLQQLQFQVDLFEMEFLGKIEQRNIDPNAPAVSINDIKMHEMNWDFLKTQLPTILPDHLNKINSSCALEQLIKLLSALNK